MRTSPRKKTSSLVGYFVFFLTIAITVTVALTLFVLIDRKTNGDTLVIALSMLCIILGISAVCTGIDVLRRKIMIDRPVGEILSATERIASGDFSVRLETLHSYDKYDDYDLIMENLNAMAAELEKSEILKTDFISNVSHEIKTPLMVIRNYVALLSKETDEENRAQYAQTITTATARLNDLITNILKLNKLENQQLRLEYQKIALHDMLAECILQFEDALERKGIEIECHLDEVEVYSSLSSLEIVWNNLLSNAVKFTDRGGKITVTLQKEKDAVLVTVADTGVGISPETGAHIFDKFYQGDTSRASEGNGLGLALVKKVIDLLGGSISVKSELGKGSAFTVTLKTAV